MAKYRVWAIMETELYLDVEADSKEEAIEIAKEADGGDFTEDDSPISGDWRIIDDVDAVDCLDYEDDDEDDLLEGDLEDQFERLMGD